jgi:L-iditol 2-dehydrogenase
MGLSAFDTVLITGLGPVGLGAIVNARFRGARVIGVESVPWRVERAPKLGAAAVLDPRATDLVAQIRELTDGRGVDCSLDCSGSVQAERLCIDATRRKGKVAFIGECGDDLAIRISPDMIRKGLTLIGSWHYNLSAYPSVMKVIRESPLIDLLISHVLPMSRIQEAFEISASHETAKILLKPWE